MSMPNDPENSKPAAPQSAPEQPQPHASAQPAAPGQPRAGQSEAAQPQAGAQPTAQYPYTGPYAGPAAQRPYPAPGPAPTPTASSWNYAVPDRGPLPPFNIMALVTFIGAFVIPVVGIVCGHIVLAEYRRGLPERGREYAKAGLILGYIFTALWLVLGVVWIIFAFTHFGHAGAGLRQGGNFGGFGGGTGGGTGGGRGFQFPTPGATPGS